MDTRRAAELKTLLRGAPLPAEKSALLEHAVQQHAEPSLLEALRSLPQREFSSLDEVVEELVHVQPRAVDTLPHPREESGAAPGGDAYAAS